MPGFWITTLLLLGSLYHGLRAEIQLDLDPAAFAGDAVLQAAQADIGTLPGSAWYEAELSGPSGFPPMYHLVWPLDDVIQTPTPVHAIRLEYGCSDSTVVLAPNSLYYVPGPAAPPLGPTGLGLFECYIPHIDPVADQQTLEETPLTILITAWSAYGDSLCFEAGVPEGDVLTEILPGPDGQSAWLTLTPDPDFYGSATIRVTAIDPAGFSGSMEFHLMVENLNDPPGPFELQSPSDGEVIQTDEVFMVWTRSVDPDPIPVFYTLFLSNSPEDLLEHPVADSLRWWFHWHWVDGAGPWYWTVRATDSEGVQVYADQSFVFGTHEDPVFSGDCEQDFGPEAAVIPDDTPQDVVLPPEAPPGTASGWDLQAVYAEYNFFTDALYIGLDFSGQAGDADGGGDPDSTEPWLAAMGGTDRAGLAGSEAICVALDTNEDGSPDLIAGVGEGTDASGYQVAHATGIDLPVSFGDPWPSVQGAHALGPDFEVAFLHYREVLDPWDWNSCFQLYAYAGSQEDAGIGEDLFSTRICLDLYPTAEAEDRPHSFGLLQNYPNPFNPRTLIPIVIQETGPVRVVVHDAAGRLVAVLFDGLLAAGRHELSFDGTACASGLYFVSLEAEGRRDTRKMLLLR